MDAKVVLYSLVTIAIISACAGEQLGNHVININSYCSGHMTDNICDADLKRLLNNISTRLTKHEQTLEEFIQSMNTEFRIRDCQDIQRLGNHTSGTYVIHPKGTAGFSVSCDMETDGGGWTVIQRRQNNSDFFKTWSEYQIGFGDVSHNHWLGNQKIRKITEHGWYELRVDLESTDGDVAYAEYNVFEIGDVNSGYQLTVDGYHGNAGDSLAYQNGQKFSTKDKDNDNYNGNCALNYSGAWWYNNCHNSNLNGLCDSATDNGVIWETFKGSTTPMKRTEMKVRPWRDV